MGDVLILLPMPTAAKLYAALLIVTLSVLARPPKPATARPWLTAPGLPAASPLARGYHVMLGLGAESGVMVFGGETAGPKVGGRIISDPWAFRHGRWEPLNQNVPAMLGTIAAYDGKSRRAIFLTEVGEGFVPQLQMLLFDPTADRWEKRGLGDGPSRLHGAKGAYHSRADRLVVLDESAATWIYDVDANTWMTQAPATSPPPRQFGAMAYDESADRTIVYGGSSRDDTWAYDLSANTWKELTPGTRPSPRHYTAMAYDPKTERMILFGGAFGPALQETALGDTWTYSYKTNTWTEVPTSEAPSPRGWHAMAYDEATAKIVLFGGGKDRRSFLGDTWTFDPQTNTWSLVR